MFSRIKKILSLRTGAGYFGASTRERHLIQQSDASGSPDGEIINDLSTLRDRSRWLYKNSAIARGAIRLLVNTVIGRGLKMQSTPNRAYLQREFGWSDEQTEVFFDKFEADIERRFDSWALSKEADYEEKLNFYEITALVFKSFLLSGEVFPTIPFQPFRNGEFRLRVGLVESDQVQSPVISGQYTGKNRDGVELDSFGRPCGYWINRNIETGSADFDFVPRFGTQSGRPLILHVFQPDRPGQNRGVPILSPVIFEIKNLDEYKRSEIIAAKVSSYFTGFIKSRQVNPFANGLTNNQTDSEKQSYGTNFKMAPGAILQLSPEDEDVVFANPSRPNSLYGPFIQSQLREIGMALGIPYEILVREFTASYSASRAARVEFEKEVKVYRDWIVNCFCRQIYNEWLNDEIIRDKIIAPGYFDSHEIMAAYSGSTWDGESMGQIDPIDEVEAANLRVQYGFSTRTQESRELTGNDYSSNIVIQNREEKIRDKYKIKQELKNDPS